MNRAMQIIQSKYIKETLKTFGIEDSRKVGISMMNIHKISKNEDFAEVNHTLYRSILETYNTLLMEDLTLFLDFLLILEKTT